MKSITTSIEKLSIDLKKELNNPKLNAVKKTYLIEKIKLIGEYLGAKEKK